MKLPVPQLRKIGWITLAWSIFSMFQFFIAYAIILDNDLKLEYSPLFYIKGNLLTGVLAGVLGGSSTVFLWERWLRSKPYGWTIRSLLITYVLIFALVGLSTNLYFYSKLLSLPPFNGAVIIGALKHLVKITTLVPFVTWLLVAVFTIIALLVNDKYGPGVFRKFLLGHYFNPRREQRIFMFLDLRASTTVAEKIGEARYFSFLKDVFTFVTPAILANKGEIYQYVGDEIVISWELAQGIEQANCVQCFFDTQQALNQRRQYFLAHYQHHPEFKAGLHDGHVMAGELGVVKREIAYSGDVLNTTARIQAKCNEFGANLLASKPVLDLLKLSAPYHPKALGQIALKGKKEPITLYAI